MLTQRNPGLRRIDVMSDSFASCVADAAKEFSRAPEVSFLEIVSQPGMLLQKRESTVPFEQLEGFGNTHRRRNLNKQVNMVDSDVKFIDFATLPVSNLSQEKFNVHPHTIKLHRVSCILAFPHKVKSILSEAVLSGFQIHFSSPEHSSHYIQQFNSGGLESRPSVFSQLTKLNFWNSGNSSLGLKAEVSLPQM